jgi:hypothetical protein
MIRICKSRMQADCIFLYFFCDTVTVQDVDGLFVHYVVMMYKLQKLFTIK